MKPGLLSVNESSSSSYAASWEAWVALAFVKPPPFNTLKPSFSELSLLWQSSRLHLIPSKQTDEERPCNKSNQSNLRIVLLMHCWSRTSESWKWAEQTVKDMDFIKPLPPVCKNNKPFLYATRFTQLLETKLKLRRSHTLPHVPACSVEQEAFQVETSDDTLPFKVSFPLSSSS